jgi:CBS domain-containing protein
MPITKKVRDLMIPIGEYAVARADRPLREAVTALRQIYCQIETGRCTEAGHRTVLVLDNGSKLVGILDFKSILKVLIPEVAGSLTQRLASLEMAVAYAEAGAPNLDERRASFHARVLRNADTKVGAIMLKVRGIIQAEADLMDALALLVRNKVTVLPVYDKDNLVGVIRDSDLFLCVAEIFAE